MLVPAIMHRIGAANWWYPARLQKITPHVSIEPPAPAPARELEPTTPDAFIDAPAPVVAPFVRRPPRQS
jgi:putative drug exporter of the RND superfamily